MANISTRSTLVAMFEETTEGTLIAPTGATDYFASQSDFEIDPAYETAENDELRGSLAPGKPIIVGEAPSASFSHYLRHSAVEGQAPTYGPKLLKGLFGAEDVEATEYDTGNGSTTGVIVLGGSESEFFRKGQVLLIKDPVNGYSLAPVHAASGATALELGFNISSAPASGVNLGKAVTYYPLNSGHPTFSLWQYLGNGGAIQAVAGVRVVSGTFNFTAREPINGSFSLEGLKYYLNPIIITSSNKWLDFNVGASELNFALTEGAYSDPHALAAAATTGMSGQASGITVTYNDSTGKYNFAKASGTLSLLWKTGTHGSDNTDTHAGTIFGFSDAADDTGVLSYDSDNALDIDAPHTPSFDDSNPLVAIDNKFQFGESASDSECFHARSVSFAINCPKGDIPDICSTSGKGGSVVTERTNEITVVATLSKYEVKNFKRFREGQEVRCFYAAGAKSGGNWIAGRNVGLYNPHCTITAYKISEEDSVATLEMTLQTFDPGDGTGETFLSMA